MDIVLPFLVTLRESLEAVLILSIIIAYLRVEGRKDLNRFVWLGTGFGILASLSVGGGALILYGGLEGLYQQIFEAIASLFAAALLTTAVIWVSEEGGSIDDRIRSQVDSSMKGMAARGLFVLTFISVFREGVETVLMLSATMLQSPLTTAVGGSAGIASGVAAGVLFDRESRDLTESQFFTVVSILLLIFASGILSYGVHESVEVAENIGIDNQLLFSDAYDLTPGDNSILHPEKGVLGAVFSSFLGAMYLSPENVTATIYLLYWLTVGFFTIRKLYPDKFRSS